jgi:hypothetical protein
MNIIMTMTKKKEERAKVGAYNFLIVGLTFFFFWFFRLICLTTNLMVLLCDFHVSQNNSPQ